MSQIIDRRSSAQSKSTVNRQRFIRRYRKQIKEAIASVIKDRCISDIDKGSKITIPKKDISEPIFHYGRGGTIERILPGNKEFMPGDRIKRPAIQQESIGSRASDHAEGEDNFVFDITREEFLNMYFDDLELPNLVKKELEKIPQYKFYNAGYSISGVPNNINVTRSMKQSLMRRISLTGNKKRKIKELEQEVKEIKSSSKKDDSKIKELEKEIRYLKDKVEKIPFIDDIDIRYKLKQKVNKPSTQAVMFCIMDVSGSMDELKKSIAKQFFILLYLFLKHNYEKIDLIFIRHHTIAKEVNEQDFFYSRETGGTVVSSSLELLNTILTERYPSADWNIYVAQASDGDNWNADSPHCSELLTSKIMPQVQYYAYIEIMPHHHQSLWDIYKEISKNFKNFAMQSIEDVKDIYPALHKLFKRKS